MIFQQRRLFATLYILVLTLCPALSSPRAHAFSGPIERTDVLMIGAGIMSGTLATFLKELDPTIQIAVYERLNRISAESSDSFNNAGTGHSALCEQNYTPLRPDGTIDISKAKKIMESFEASKQFWAYLVQHGNLGNPDEFIHAVPHFSWVKGDDDVSFLRKRYEALKAVPTFRHMEYSEDNRQINEWLPLMAQGRNPGEKMAATRSLLGTDIDFGALTRQMFHSLETRHNTPTNMGHEVRSIQKNDDGTWTVKIRDFKNKKTKVIVAKKVFIGAGGGALPLLQKTQIKEAEGYGGFPVSGQFLVTDNPELIAAHYGKVYGRPAAGSPPMSVPHLDVRIVDGRKVLMFGPFAGFATRFLKQSSDWDLFRSVSTSNLVGMLSAGVENVPLISYLANQVTLSHEDRMNILREFIPNARSEDWKLLEAGQRVQIIKSEPSKETLRFGTEVVSNEEGSVAALLGASPGASTAVTAMLEVLQRLYPEQMKSKVWMDKLKTMILSYGQELASDEAMMVAVRHWSNLVLGLEQTGPCQAALVTDAAPSY